MPLIESIASLLPPFLVPVHTSLRIARSKLAGGDYTSAFRAADHVLGRLSNKLAASTLVGEAWLLKGKSLVLLGSSEEATAALVEAHKHGASDPDSLRLLAYALLKKKETSQAARNVYLDYLGDASFGDSPDRLRENLSHLRVISTPDPRGVAQDEASRRWNESIISRREDLAWAHEHLGRIALAEGDWKRAILSLDRAYRLQSDEYQTHRLLAYALAKDGQFMAAKRHLDLLVSAKPRRGTLVLRGHVSRRLGNPVAAVKDYRCAEGIAPFGKADALGYVEALLNSGQIRDATRVIKAFLSEDDPRWLLLSAVAYEMTGELSEALQRFCRIATDVNLGVHAESRIVGIAVRTPSVSGITKALHAIPDARRNKTYWIALGNACLVNGQYRDALECWNKAAPSEGDLVGTAGNCARYYCVNLYRRGQDSQICQEAPLLLGNPAYPEEVRAVVTAGIARNAIRQLRSGAQSPTECIDSIVQAETLLPPGTRCRHLALVRGLAQAASGHYQRAFETLSTAVTEGAADPEAAHQLARCALHNGDPETCSIWLKSLDGTDRRVARLRVAYAASIGDWDRAATELDSAFLEDTELGIKAAILLRAGRRDVLLQIPPGRGDVRYYQAVAQVGLSDQSAAAEMLSDIPQEDPVRPAANRLLGWIMLQQSRLHFAVGMHRVASQSLLSAIRMWPEDDGPLSCFRNGDHKLVRICVLADDRDEARIWLERHAIASGPGDPATCHNLAVFHLAEGSRLVAANKVVEGIANWERAIAYVCVSLAHDDYLRDWIEERQATYGFDISEQAHSTIESGIVQLYESVFAKSEEAVRAAGRMDDADRLSSLALLLRAELRAARMLAEVGGFKPARQSRQRIWAGPTYVHLAGLTPRFASFYEGLKVKRLRLPDITHGSEASFLRDLLKAVSEDSEGVEVAAKTELGRLFSTLRLAAILQRDGRLEEALHRLRRAKSLCVLMSGNDSCKGSLLAGCGQSRQDFAACNPAFSGKNAVQQFRSFAAEFEAELLMEFGGLEVSSTGDHVQFGLSLWREAIELAPYGEHRDELASKIRQLAIGRSNVLQQKEQFDGAIELLKSVSEFCGNLDLQGELSIAYARRGVVAGNADSWDASISDLRLARRLNPHSSYVNTNLIAALRGGAASVAEKRAEESWKLLREAVEVAQEGFGADPHNDEFRKMVAQARAELAMASLMAGNESRPEDVLTALMAGTDGGTRHLSTVYHNQGVEKARNDDFAGATLDLERALELEPGSDASRQVLTQIVRAHAASLVKEGQYDQALAALDRAFRFDPDDPSLKQEKAMVMLLRMVRRRGK